MSQKKRRTIVRRIMFHVVLFSDIVTARRHPRWKLLISKHEKMTKKALAKALRTLRNYLGTPEARFIIRLDGALYVKRPLRSAATALSLRHPTFT